MVRVFFRMFFILMKNLFGYRLRYFIERNENGAIFSLLKPELIAKFLVPLKKILVIFYFFLGFFECLLIFQISPQDGCSYL